ncbi:MAG: flagellar basal body L-ring protein FlgH [Gammaproteobacteria bacterium]
MNIRRVTTVLVAVTAQLALAACSSVHIGPQPGKYPPAPPVNYDAMPVTSGTIYQPARGLSLFDDVKARRIGDTVTIRLAERTQASKSASTDAKKDSSIDTGAPILLGGGVTSNGDPVLSNKWSTAQEFGGTGSSSQSNRLDGNITVTVADVYPNGNLLVRGEKWLTLNQGQEFVQISGIVRPVDIGTDNSVPSFKVADARITYSGSGTLADANRPGLLTRFFMKLWPL